MSKRSLILVVVLCIVALFATMKTADAACRVWVKVVLAYTASNGYTYVYASPLTNYPTYYYYFRIPPTNFTGSSAYYSKVDRLASQMFAAQVSNATVYAYGTALSCPTTGTVRYGGDLYYALTYSNR